MKTKIEIGQTTDWPENNKRPVLVLGPCSAESEEQVMNTARGIANLQREAIFRAGIWKPRTRPNSFEGMGSVALPWLVRVKQELGMKVSTEVANAQHVEECLRAGVDVLWIGARTTVNPFSVQEIADALKGVDIPVMVKNPVTPDLQLWIGALERLNRSGITKLMGIHRGFHAVSPGPFRNDPRWELLIEFRTACPKLPVICDPSHITGSSELVPYISQRAMDMDMDGLMIETHCMPAVALSDAGQQITPAALGELLKKLVIRESTSGNDEFRDRLERLREKINRADEEMLCLLMNRMKVAEEIGQYKKENNVTILQSKRWENLLNERMSTAAVMGLSQEFVKAMYLLIHEESIRKQNKIMNKINS